MNELQDTLKEIMEIFKCQDNMLDILEHQQHQLEQLKSVNQEQLELYLTGLVRSGMTAGSITKLPV